MTIWQDVEGLFEGRAEPRVRPIDGHRMYGPALDDDPPTGTEIMPSDVEGLTVGILYRDGNGQLSDRVIRCLTLHRGDEHLYVEAECALRNASRTFRLDRIQELTDYTTGEVIADIGGFFAPYFDAGMPDQLASTARPARESAWIAPTTANPRIAGAFRDGARVLLYLALSDGELHPAEHDFIVRYGVTRLQRLPQPPRDPDNIVRRWIDNHVPTRTEALAALNRLCRNDADGEEIAHAMIDLILADGHTSDGEMAAAWHIQQILEKRERTKPRSER